MAKKDSVNPLNVLEVRRVEFCPPYFESITISPTYNLARALNDWIYENLSGRYYIGQTVDIGDSQGTKQKIKVGFENPTEMSFFMLACPILKYNK